MRGRGRGILGGLSFGNFPPGIQGGLTLGTFSPGARKRPSLGATITVTSEAAAASRAREEEAHYEDEPGVLTPSVSATLMSEVESMEQDSTPTMVPAMVSHREEARRRGL